MKFRVTLKDPDGVYDAVSDAAAVFMPDRKSEEFEIQKDVIYDFIRQWVRCGEYVTIEFDTVANTCVVVQ